MEQLLEEFYKQLQSELLLEGFSESLPTEIPYKNIYIAGMGGSGIGASLVRSMVIEDSPIPIIVRNSYDIPRFIGPETLFIASSYSGNTEETLEVCKKAHLTGATVVVISSGGMLTDFAKDNNLKYCLMPGGYSSPRACLGYSMVAHLTVLTSLGLISGHILQELRKSADLIRYDQDEIRNKAQRIAHILQDKLPVIYCGDRMEPVGLRIRQQLNENAKMLCWHNSIPEMNHNELVGWRDNYNHVAAIFLKNKESHPRNQARFALTREIVSEFTDTVVEVFTKGDNYIQRIQYLIHLGDWISVFLGEMRNRDVMEVKVIDYLKGALAEME
jgi:glucose/mannose-6-phosphate isomerase